MAKRRYSFWIDEAHLEGLRVLEPRLGMPESEQIRQALADWLAKHGGPRPLLMDHTRAVQEIRQGHPVALKCPDCGGALIADLQSTSRLGSPDRPQHVQRFWSTRCNRCSHQFNYIPDEGKLERITIGKRKRR